MPRAWKTYVELCCYGNGFTYRLHYSCCNKSFMESLPFCIVPAVSLTPRSQQPSSKFYGISNPDHLSARVAKGQHNLVKAGTPRGAPFFQQGRARLGSKEKESRERKSGISPPAFWNSIRQVLRSAHIHPSYFFVVDRIKCIVGSNDLQFYYAYAYDDADVIPINFIEPLQEPRAYPTGARSVLNITINASLDTVNSTHTLLLTIIYITPSYSLQHKCPAVSINLRLSKILRTYEEYTSSALDITCRPNTRLKSMNPIYTYTLAD